MPSLGNLVNLRYCRAWKTHAQDHPAGRYIVVRCITHQDCACLPRGQFREHVDSIRNSWGRRPPSRSTTTQSWRRTWLMRSFCVDGPWEQNRITCCNRCWSINNSFNCTRSHSAHFIFPLLDWPFSQTALSVIVAAPLCLRPPPFRGRRPNLYIPTLIKLECRSGDPA